MTMSQDVQFCCMHCKKYFDLSTDQVDTFMACGTVVCPQCSQSLGFKEHDLAKLVAVKSKNERKIWVFGFLSIGMPLLNILVVLQWGIAMGFVGFFVTFFVFATAVPGLKEVAFIRLDLEPRTQVVQG